MGVGDGVIVAALVNGNDGVAVIACSVFGAKTMRDLDDGLKQAQDANAKGVILDLRNNPGGYVDAAPHALVEARRPTHVAAHREARHRWPCRWSRGWLARRVVPGARA